MQRRSDRQSQGNGCSSPTENQVKGALLGRNGTTKGKAYQASPATRIHDDINIAVLTIMSALAAWSMYEHQPAVQYGLTVFGLGYMFLDAIYIASYMDSVKNPKTILGHHLATIIVLFDPLMIPCHALYTSWALLVEVNTTLLILRRRVSWGGSWFVEMLFVLTWVGLRIIWYPIITLIIVLATFPKLLTPYYPDVLIDWRYRVESASGEQPTQIYYMSCIAWVIILIFQGWKCVGPRYECRVRSSTLIHPIS